MGFLVGIGTAFANPGQGFGHALHSPGDGIGRLHHLIEIGVDILDALFQLLLGPGHLIGIAAGFHSLLGHGVDIIRDLLHGLGAFMHIFKRLDGLGAEHPGLFVQIAVAFKEQFRQH